MNLLLVMLGGSLGAASRYAINLLSVRWGGSHFPYGTLAVNLAGCFMIGLAFGLTGRSNLMSPAARLFFVTGFLGAMTTFSTYAMETVGAAGAGSFQTAAVNILLNNLMGLGLVVAGLGLSRYLV
jgi:CrcB protein